MKRAIVIEDVQIIRDLVGLLLKHMGLEVVGTAGDGQAGFELFQQEKPDVVFMDVDMPVQNGLTTLKAIKDVNPDATVIMLSAHSDQLLVDDCILEGAADFIRKDVPPQEMEHRFRDVMKKIDQTG